MFKHVETKTTIPDTQGHQAIIRITGEVDCDTRTVRNIQAYDVTDARDQRTDIASKYERAKMEAMLLREAACAPVEDLGVVHKGTVPNLTATDAPGSAGNVPGRKP